MKFSSSIIITAIAALATGALANPATGHLQAQALKERAAYETLGRIVFTRELLGRDSSACCMYEACVNDCENGFSSNPVGEGACISSCGNTSGTGGQACYCCADHSQQPGSDGTSACANNGGGDDNTSDCTC